jgi:hypothetical protein
MKKSTKFLSCCCVAALIAFVCCCRVSQDPRDLPFRTGTIDRRADGTLERALLVEPAELDGYPCKGWVMRHDNGRLQSFHLSADLTLQGHLLPADTRVFFDRDGKLAHAWLPRETTLAGHACRGSMKIDTAFHPDGSIAAFFPPDDVRIDGILCEASVFHPVYLHPNGRLRQAKLAEAVRVGERVFERGATITLDEAGAPAL